MGYEYLKAEFDADYEVVAVSYYNKFQDIKFNIARVSSFRYPLQIRR